jgi:hypothetical protein
MRQAQTLNEAQLCRVLHYSRRRRHPTRDQTIIMVSFYAGLGAMAKMRLISFLLRISGIFTGSFR